jgi:hypothetical protein
LRTPQGVRGADDHRNVPKRDEALDEQMHLLLGIAVAWCQQLETALVQLLDARQHDTTRPLEERWATVSTWLDQVAGRLVRELRVAPEIETDLRAAIGRRNRLVHDAWRLYHAGQDQQASFNLWEPWLRDEAVMIYSVGRGVEEVAAALRDARATGTDLGDSDMVGVWRREVPAPVKPRPDR